MIDFQQLGKRYGTFDAVTDLSFTVARGELFGCLGPNGAAWAALKSAKNLVKTQSGYVYHYAFVMFLGVVGLLSYVLWLAR